MYRHEVIVGKAGNHFANGRYEFDGWMNGFPCFCRKATTPSGKCMEFLIYQTPPSKQKNRDVQSPPIQSIRPSGNRSPESSPDPPLAPSKSSFMGPVGDLIPGPCPTEPLERDSMSTGHPAAPSSYMASLQSLARGTNEVAPSTPSPEIAPAAFDSSSKGGSPPPISLDDETPSLPTTPKRSLAVQERRWVLCKIENHGFRRGRSSARGWEDSNLVHLYRAPPPLKNPDDDDDKALIPPEIGWVPVKGDDQALPEFKCQSQTTDIWDVGSEVEVFSTSQQRWKRAKITEIVGDEFKVQSQQDNWKSTVRRGSGRIRPGKQQLVERSEWDVDTEVEVYSTSKQRWKDAVIIDTKPLRVEYTDGTGGKWMALGSDWLRKPGEPESPTDLLKSEGEGLASHLSDVIKDIFWNFYDHDDNMLKLDDIREWLACCMPRNGDQAIRTQAAKILRDYGGSQAQGLTLYTFFKYYEDACHDRPKAVRHDLVNLGYKRFARKGHARTWENGTRVEAYSKTQRRWKRATIVHVIESGGKLHIQYSDNTGRKWMARYSDRLRPKMTLETILRTRRFSEVVRAVSESQLGNYMPISVIRELVLLNFEQCNHCLYYDDTTKKCCNKGTVCRTCNTDGLNFHNCEKQAPASPPP